MRANLGKLLGATFATIIFGGCGSNGGGTTTQVVYVTSDAGPGATTDAPSGKPPEGPPSPCRVAGDEIRVTQTQGAASAPVLTWTGTDYLVAWADDRSGAGDIYAARLTSEGLKQAPEWAVATTPGVSSSPSIVAVPGGFIAGWQEIGADGGAFVTQALDANGLPKAGAASPSVVSKSGAGEIRPHLAAAFDGAAASWMDLRTGDGAPSGTTASDSAAWIARLTAEGALLRPPDPVVLGAGASATKFPALAASSSLLAAAYVDYRAGHGDVRVGLFDPSLAQTTDVLVRDAPGDASNPSADWDGGQFVLSWEDLRSGDEQIYLSRVTPDGTVEAPIAVPDDGTGSANWPRTASSAGATVVVFYQFRGGPPQVYLAFLGPDGSKKGGDLRVSQGTSGKARFPSVVRGANEYGVVWEDTRFGTPQVMFARVNCP